MDQYALIEGIDSAARSARWTRALLLLATAVMLARLVVDWQMHDALARLEAGERLAQTEASALDARLGLVSQVFLGAFVVTLVAWLTWVERATANLRLAGAGTSRFAPHWAVGWHFVPIFNVWRVPEVLHDIETRSADRNEAGAVRGEPTGLVVGWASAFILASVAGRIAGQFADGAEDLADRRVAQGLSLARDLFLIVAGVLAWLVVRRIDRTQRELLVLAPPAARSSDPRDDDT